MSRNSASRVRVVTIGVVLACAAVRASAQTVRGAVRDRAAQPVAGVVLSLLDSTNAVLARALSDERGEFRMLSSRSGTMRLQAQRIGFTLTRSEPFLLEAGATVTPIMLLEGVPSLLSAVRVTASTSCGRADAGRGEAGGDALLAVWEQAQTSLAASLLTAGVRDLTTNIMHVRRRLTAGGRLLKQESELRSANVVVPWVGLPIDTLRTRGYVWTDSDNMINYSAPGLDGFVSPRFLEDHCFRLVASKDTSEIGIQFDPIPMRAHLSEIRGTMWIARASAELRRTEFTYTRTPGLSSPSFPAGGTMRFVRLASGAVLIDEWELRMPVMGTAHARGSRTRIDHIQVTGGQLVSLLRGADTVYARPVNATTRGPARPDAAPTHRPAFF